MLTAIQTRPDAIPALFKVLVEAANKAGKEGEAAFDCDDDGTFVLKFRDGRFEGAVGLAPGKKDVYNWTPVFINDGNLKNKDPLFVRYRWVPNEAAAAAA